MKLNLVASVILLSLALGACTLGNNASVELSGLNYTDTGISAFSVDGADGPGIYPNGGGGKFVCCVMVPRRWREGMSVTVRWTHDERLTNSWKERVVSVPKYAENDLGGFVVHFYPNDVVKVLVTTKIVGHPDYPYPRPN